MILGESASEKHNREAQLDDNRTYSKKIAEATGEPIQYTDEFTKRVPLNDSVFDRVPKCCKPKPLKPKEKK